MVAKNQNHKKFLKNRFNQINKAIGKFETEVEKAVNKFMKRGEESSRIIRKNLEEILEKISASEVYSKASEKTEVITKEVRKIADDVLLKLKKFDFGKANGVLKEVREGIDQIVEKVQHLEIVEIAREKAVDTRKQVLNVLRIPSKDEVESLSRKIKGLEKKIENLSKQAA